MQKTTQIRVGPAIDTTTSDLCINIIEQLEAKVKIMKNQAEQLKREVKNSLWLWKQTRDISFVNIDSTYVPLSYACVLNYMAGRVLCDIVEADPGMNRQANFSDLYSNNPDACHHFMQFFMKRSSDEEELACFCKILASASLLPPTLRELIDERMLDSISEYLSKKQRSNQAELVDSLVLRASTMVVGDGLTNSTSSAYLCIESLEDDFDDDDFE